MSTAVATSSVSTVKAIVALPEYRRRFDEVLGPERSAAFLGSLTALTADRNLAECEPRSVVAAAFVAATLDLPIQKNLGFAWIVPYKGVGQFQIGWKGVVQLALRSGQYRRLNAFKVNAEAYRGTDEFGEALLDPSQLDDSKAPVGYAVSWELLNGFKKVVYWSREKCLAHAQRYSQAYRSKGKFDTPWKTHEDEMCLKTVAINGLRTWGALSVQMQRAAVEDQAVRMDIDAEPVYLDGTPQAPDEPLPGTNGSSKADSLAAQLGGASVTRDGDAAAQEQTESADEIALNAAEIGEQLGMKSHVVRQDIKLAREAGGNMLRQLRDGWAVALKNKGKNTTASREPGEDG